MRNQVLYCVTNYSTTIPQRQCYWPPTNLFKCCGRHAKHFGGGGNRGYSRNRYECTGG